MKKICVLLCMVVALITMGPSISPKAAESENVHLVIESYEIVSGEVLPGSEVEVKLVIRNTNAVNVAQNVVLSVINNQGIAVPIQGASNQTVVGDVLGGGTKEVVVPMRITKQAGTEENLTLLFYLTFADGRDIEVTNEAYISIPVKEKYLVEITELELADLCRVNENSIVSSAIKNGSDVPIRDAALHVIPENGEEKIYLIGDIDNGLMLYFDHKICMTQAGEQMLTTYLSYKDDTGKSLVTQKKKFKVRVLEESAKNPSQDTKSTVDVDIKFLFTNLILVLLAVAIIYVSRKRETRRINSGKEVGDGKRG